MMKKLTLIASVVLSLLVFSCMVSAATTIAIDGDFSDWIGVPQYDVAPNPIEPTGDVANGPNDDLDLVDIYITDDGAYIYFKYNVVGTMNESSNYYEVFLDTDRSTATGYRGPAGTWTLGADYMVENNDLYEYNGTGGSNWSWVSSEAPNFARAIGNSNTVEMRIPRATIGETGTSDDLDFLIRATDNSTSPTQWDIYPEATYGFIVSFCSLDVTVTFITSNGYSGGIPNAEWYPPGAAYTLTFRVKNTGTCPYDEVYDLDAYILTGGWPPPVAPADTGPLGPGEFVNVLVTGNVPAAPAGVETRLVHLKATSQNHSTTDDTYRRVGVDGVPPTAAFTHWVSGLTVYFDASGSTDFTPVGSGIDRYEWDFGDGSTGSGVSSSHTYGTGGTYTVTLRVWDKTGNDGTGTAKVTHPVNPVPEFPLGVEAAAAIGLMVAVVYISLRRRKIKPIAAKRFTTRTPNLDSYCHVC